MRSRARPRRSSSGTTATSSGRRCSTRCSTRRWRGSSYGRARRFIVSSPALGEHAAALAPYRDRVRVIPFGIDPAAWTAARSRAATDGEPFVLFAGRHVAYKGVDVLLRALRGTRHPRGDRRRRAEARRMGSAGARRSADPARHVHRRRARRGAARDCCTRARRSGAAVGDAGRGVRLRAARGDGLRQAGDQHRRAERRVVGQPARADRAHRAGGRRGGAAAARSSG